MNLYVLNIDVEKTARAEKICPFDRTTTEWMRKFFPPGFPFDNEARLVGVKTIEAVALDMDLAGRHIAPEYKILLNTDLDWKEMAGRLNCNFPDLGIRTEEHARAFMYLHECGHASNREDIMARDWRDPDGNPTTMKGLLAIRKDRLRRGKNLSSVEKRISEYRLVIHKGEKAADAYAVERFRKWKQETK